MGTDNYEKRMAFAHSFSFGLKLWKKKPILNIEQINSMKSKEAYNMRIDALNQVGQIYDAKGNRKVNRASKAADSDKVEISSFGKDLQIAKQAVAGASDIREEKVAEYRKRIANGTYNVSAEAFADKILAEYDE